MFKRWFLFISIVVSILTLVFAFSNNTNAADEDFGYDKYNKIYANHGIFDNIKPVEGGTSAIELIQDKDNPQIYKANVGKAECDGEVSISFRPGADSIGTFKVGSNCDVLKKLNGKNVDIKGADLAKKSVNKDIKILEGLFKKSLDCDSKKNDTEKSECNKSLKSASTEHKKECRARYDYATDITKSDKFLDCLAEKFGVERPADEDEKEDEKEEKKNNSCTIGEDVGWVVCQASLFLARTADRMFKFIEPFMVLEPLKEHISLEKETIENPTFKAWTMMRDISLALLVVAFVISLIAYMTGYSSQVFSLQRSLPRLVVASIFIPLSFTIFAIGVDISNITGVSLRSLLESENISADSDANDCKNYTEIANTINSTDNTSGAMDKCGEKSDKDKSKENDKDKIKEGNKDAKDKSDTKDEDKNKENEDEDKTTSVIINGNEILGKSAVIAILAIFFPTMLVAAFAMLTVIIILLFRQAAVIMLIIIAPIAILGLIFPNTKGLFKKWSSTSIQLLLVYPILALLFAATNLAADVILDAASNNSQLLLGVFTMAIRTIPLFIAPAVIKFGGSAIGNFNGGLANVRQPIQSWSKKRVAANANSRRQGRDIRMLNGEYGEKAKKYARAKQTRRAFMAGINERDRQYQHRRGQITGQVIDKELGGIKNDELREYLINSANDEAIESNMKNIENEKINLQSKNIPQSELENMALEGTDSFGNKINTERRQAAIELSLAGTSDTSYVDRLAEKTRDNMNSAERSAFVRGAKNAGHFKKDSSYGGGAQTKLKEQGFADHKTKVEVKNTINSMKYSMENLTNQSIESLDKIHTVASDTRSGVTDAALLQLQRNISGVLKNPTLRNKLSDDKINKLNDIKNINRANTNQNQQNNGGSP